MATLQAHLTNLAGAIRDKFNAIAPRLLPAGGAAGARLAKTSADDHAVAWTPEYATILFVIDGGGAAITTGVKGDLVAPFACVVEEWTLLADQAGSIVVDVWKDTFANAPPAAGDSITASAKPTLTNAAKAQSATLTGWATAIASGDVLRFNVDSAATVVRATLSLKVRKV